jgi:hypothetical protein
MDTLRAPPSEAGFSEAGTVYTSASRAIDQAWGGTDWSAVLRSLAVPSGDDGTPQVRTRTRTRTHSCGQGALGSPSPLHLHRERVRRVLRAASVVAELTRTSKQPRTTPAEPRPWRQRREIHMHMWAGRSQVQLKDVVKVLAMAEAALKAKSVAAERKAFVAATHAYEQGAAVQSMVHACNQQGHGDLVACMEQVRWGTLSARESGAASPVLSELSHLVPDQP